MEKKHVVATRLAKARSDAKMSQVELLNELNARTGRNLTASVVSSWEIGRRTIPERYISELADILGTTEEYLCATESDEFEGDPVAAKIVKDSILDVPITDLSKYNREAIYVVFENHEYENQWAVYNGKTQKLVFADFSIKITSVDLKKYSFKMYATKPFYAESARQTLKNRLDINNIMTQEEVFVIMNSEDELVHAKYDGWYKNDMKAKCLINTNGRVLTYEGLNIGYHAFTLSRINLV